MKIEYRVEKHELRVGGRHVSRSFFIGNEDLFDLNVVRRIAAEQHPRIKAHEFAELCERIEKAAKRAGGRLLDMKKGTVYLSFFPH